MVTGFISCLFGRRSSFSFGRLVKQHVQIDYELSILELTDLECAIRSEFSTSRMMYLLKLRTVFRTVTLPDRLMFNKFSLDLSISSVVFLS